MHAGAADQFLSATNAVLLLISCKSPCTRTRTHPLPADLLTTIVALSLPVKHHNALRKRTLIHDYTIFAKAGNIVDALVGHTDLVAPW